MIVDSSQIARAAESLRRGGMVVFPTETFYGIGCRAEDAKASERIVAAKGRRRGNPFPVIAADPNQARALWTEVPDWAARLIEGFWPGPLTIVLPARAGLPHSVAGSGEVGVRVSPHPIALELSRQVGPLVATSANRAGGVEVTTIAEVDPLILSAADVVVDDGRTPGGKPSTVVSATGGVVRILREGAIPREPLGEALKGVARLI